MLKLDFKKFFPNKTTKNSNLVRFYFNFKVLLVLVVGGIILSLDYQKLPYCMVFWIKAKLLFFIYASLWSHCSDPMKSCLIIWVMICMGNPVIQLIGVLVLVLSEILLLTSISSFMHLRNFQIWVIPRLIPST